MDRNYLRNWFSNRVLRESAKIAVEGSGFANLRLFELLQTKQRYAMQCYCAVLQCDGTVGEVVTEA